MYIKSVIIDGFKSYGKRIEIKDFDPEFNAITGLNGTGKSNILDAICFVLGIVTLSHVRVSTLQDLIYKSGQSGVTKATVTILFDNNNEDQCPPGFEGYDEISISRQVAVGGKSKYWINGSIVPNKKVHDMFCTIQLNVNNPHFLIMQGRITKVLNMKPHEILAMVEEAAGTKMYESKRQAAQKTIDKKEAKLAELNLLFEEEIFPRLEKLRQERQAYLEFLRIEREIEHMMALYQAWLYYATQRQTKRAETKLKDFELKIVEVKNEMLENNEHIKQIEVEIDQVSKNEDNTNLQKLEASVKEKEKEDAIASAAENQTKVNIAAQEKAVKVLEKNCKNDEATLLLKKSEQAKVQGLFESLKNKDEKDRDAFALSQRKFEAVSAGMEVNEDGETQTLQEQLMHAKKEAAQSSTEMKTANMELISCQSQLKDKQKEFGANASEYNKDAANVAGMEKLVNRLKADIEKINFSEDQMAEMTEKRRGLMQTVRTLRDRVEHFERNHADARFSYSDPYPGFDRNKIFGVVCKLLEVKDPNNALSLEVVAGRKLSNVIGATKDVCKDVVNKGNLADRKTFIPLDQISYSVINPKMIQIAQHLCGKENVQTAISLISYDRKYEAAMAHVFGGVFICKNLQIARQIAFHPQIMRKCVTLDGDVADPSGTLTGGAPPKGIPLLVAIREFIEFEAELKLKEAELIKLEATMRAMGRGQEQYEQLKHQLEVKQVEFNMMTSRMQQTTHHQQQEEIEHLKARMLALKARLQECETIEANATKKVKDLEYKMRDAKGHRERQLKEAADEMKQNKLQSEQSRKEWQKHEQTYDILNLEVVELQKGIETMSAQIITTNERIAELRSECVALEEKCAALKLALVERHAELKAEKSAVAAKNKQVQKMLNTKEKLFEKNSELQLCVKKNEQDITKYQDEFEIAKNKEEAASLKLNRKDERSLNEAKDLSDKDGNELANKINKSKDKKTQLSRTVNTKAQSMFEHEEKQFNTFSSQKDRVEADRRRLKAVMADLDKKKTEALELAFAQISKDFGSIFSTLLPGANAKLSIPQGKSILNGLEVKISLDGIWKESLTELSGGQRSLVALSLILAMLLFKPAPLYILDEVDAALDLSHTQNIGNMLKTHFKQSQFIIVSLKDGMFNNANVLFRTKFVDGMSVVSKTVNSNF